MKTTEEFEKEYLEACDAASKAYADALKVAINSRGVRDAAHKKWQESLEGDRYNLDARVAEKVMRLALSWETVGDKVIPRLKTEDGLNTIPRYSTDMNSALKVIEALEILGLLTAMYQWDSDEGRLWGVDIDGVGSIKSGEHRSLPIAICLAALKAVGDGDWVDEYLKDQSPVQSP